MYKYGCKGVPQRGNVSSLHATPAGSQHVHTNQLHFWYGKGVLLQSNLIRCSLLGLADEAEALSIGATCCEVGISPTHLHPR